MNPATIVERRIVQMMKLAAYLIKMMIRAEKNDVMSTTRSSSRQHAVKSLVRSWKTLPNLESVSNGSSASVSFALTHWLPNVLNPVIDSHLLTHCFLDGELESFLRVKRKLSLRLSRFWKCEVLSWQILLSSAIAYDVVTYFISHFNTWVKHTANVSTIIVTRQTAIYVSLRHAVDYKTQLELLVTSLIFQQF